jgi:hypothetical protein
LIAETHNPYISKALLSIIRWAHTSYHWKSIPDHIHKEVLQRLLAWLPQPNLTALAALKLQDPFDSVRCYFDEGMSKLKQRIWSFFFDIVERNPVFRNKIISYHLAEYIENTLRSGIQPVVQCKDHHEQIIYDTQDVSVNRQVPEIVLNSLLLLLLADLCHHVDLTLIREAIQGLSTAVEYFTEAAAPVVSQVRTICCSNYINPLLIQR